MFLIFKGHCTKEYLIQSTKVRYLGEQLVMLSEEGPLFKGTLPRSL